MGSILRVKDAQGNWIEIPAIVGRSAYEIAVAYGYEGAEEEWINAVNEASNKARAAANEANNAKVAAQNSQAAALRIQNATGEIRDEAREARDEAISAKEISVSAASEAFEFAKASNENANTAIIAAEEAAASAGRLDEFVDGVESSLATINNKVEANLRETQEALIEVNETTDRFGDRVTEVEEQVYSIASRVSEFISLHSFITIKGGADNWVRKETVDGNGELIGYRYGQVVEVEGAEITSYSKVDMQINSEQMAIFYEKDLAFVTENVDGVITVYCIGQIPENTYRIQVTVTEVVRNG